MGCQAAWGSGCVLDEVSPEGLPRSEALIWFFRPLTRLSHHPHCTSMAAAPAAPAAPGWAWLVCPFFRKHPFLILHFRVSFEMSGTAPRIRTRCFQFTCASGEVATPWPNPPNPTGTWREHLPMALALGHQEGVALGGPPGF